MPIDPNDIIDVPVSNDQAINIFNKMRGVQSTAQQLDNIQSDLNSLGEGQIPVMRSGRIVQSGLVSSQDGEIATSANTVIIGATSIENRGGFLTNQNLVTGLSFQVIDARIDQTTGSNRPNQFYAASGSQEVVINSDDSTNMTANPLVTNYTTQLTGYTYAVTIKTFAEMTNVKIQLRDTSSGVITRQYPSALSFDDDTRTDGYTLPVGEVTFFFTEAPDNPPSDEIYLGLNPFTFFPNRQLEFTIKADSVSLLGDGTSLFTKVQHQAATPRGLAFQDEIRTDEQIQDLMSTTLVAGTNVTLNYDDTAGTLTINAAGGGGSFNAPRITNFAVQGLPSRVDLNTDLNVQRTITFDVMHASNIQGDLTLEVTTGDNITIAGPFTDGANIRSVTFSGIDSSSAGTLTNQITGTDTQNGTIASNTISTAIRNIPPSEILYYGVVDNISNPENIDESLLTQQQVIAGTNFQAVFTLPSTQFAIILSPADREINTIYNAAFPQTNIRNDFNKVENVTTISGQQYDLYSIENRASISATLTINIEVS